jgi:coenzyme PQQ precursor peptide PqqA
MGPVFSLFAGAADPLTVAGRTERLADACGEAQACLPYYSVTPVKELHMAWSTPTLVEICIGLEINGYLPAEL